MSRYAAYRNNKTLHTLCQSRPELPGDFARRTLRPIVAEAIGFVASAVFIAFSVFVARPGSNYRFSALFPRAHRLGAPTCCAADPPAPAPLSACSPWRCCCTTWAPSGFISASVLGLSFDIYVHFYFGFVGGLLLHRLPRPIPSR